MRVQVRLKLCITEAMLAPSMEHIIAYPVKVYLTFELVIILSTSSAPIAKCFRSSQRLKLVDCSHKPSSRAIGSLYESN